MELQRKYCSNLFFVVVVLLLHSFFFSGSVDAYKNYTVGDSLGWYDNLKNPKVNYQKWVAAKNFSLGDFLIFNTDTNHSVVQTYNLTTYKLCDYDDAQENDTIQWSSADPSNTATQPVSVEVPLLKEGMSYFFSGDYDGEQCKNGQHFKIKVSHGQGLPKSLQNPATQNQSPGPASGPQSGNDEDSIPDTIVPSNFDHPHEDDTGEQNPSGSVALSIYAKQGMVVPVFILLMRFYIF
ncbi:hypothetical protein ACE6H2_015605 [Prunus campanulata]